MADPVWGELAQSQSDNTTISEAIAALIVAHNTDPNAHYDTGAAMDIHRAADVIDHPDLSVQASTLTIDVQGVGEKAGSIPAAGVDWQAAGTVPAGTYLAVEYGVIGTIKFVAVGEAGKNINSSDGDDWVAGTAIDAQDWSLLRFGNDVFVAANVSGAGAKLAYSTDGENWTLVTGLLTGHCMGLEFDGTDFYAWLSAQTSIPYTTSLYKSSDGQNWTSQGNTTGASSFTVAFSSELGGFFYGVSNSAYIYSYDGLAFSGGVFAAPFYYNFPVQIGPTLIGPLVFDSTDYDPELVINYGYEVSSVYDIVQTSDKFGGNFGRSQNEGLYAVFSSDGSIVPTVFVTANGATFFRVSIAVDGYIWDLASAPDRYVLCTNASSGNRIAWSDIPT